MWSASGVWSASGLRLVWVWSAPGLRLGLVCVWVWSAPGLCLGLGLHLGLVSSHFWCIIGA